MSDSVMLEDMLQTLPAVQGLAEHVLKDSFGRESIRSLRRLRSLTLPAAECTPYLRHIVNLADEGQARLIDSYTAEAGAKKRALITSGVGWGIGMPLVYAGLMTSQHVEVKLLSSAVFWPLAFHIVKSVRTMFKDIEKERIYNTQTLKQFIDLGKNSLPLPDADWAAAVEKHKYSIYEFCKTTPHEEVVDVPYKIDRASGVRYEQ